MCEWKESECRVYRTKTAQWERDGLSQRSCGAVHIENALNIFPMTFTSP
jgi:hypothetical protein